MWIISVTLSVGGLNLCLSFNRDCWHELGQHLRVIPVSLDKILAKFFTAGVHVFLSFSLYVYRRL